MIVSGVGTSIHIGNGDMQTICSVGTHDLRDSVPAMRLIHDSDDIAANAEFVVRACNAHDDLLAACEALMNSLPYDKPAVAQAKAAIAKARGEQ